MTIETTSPEQLTLLPQADVPLRFRLDDATRRRGLQHVAEIRRMLAASARASDRPTAQASDTPRATGSRRAA